MQCPNASKPGLLSRTIRIGKSALQILSFDEVTSNGTNNNTTMGNLGAPTDAVNAIVSRDQYDSKIIGTTGRKKLTIAFFMTTWIPFPYKP